MKLSTNNLNRFREGLILALLGGSNLTPRVIARFNSYLFFLCLLMVFSTGPELKSEDNEWHLGFEPKEGFTIGLVETNHIFSILGGKATVVASNALEGEQALHFVPLCEANGLLINLPSDSERGNRTISFQTRLVGDSPDSRLVISYGETLGIRPFENGIELEVLDKAKSDYRLEGVFPSDWIEFSLEESVDSKTWGLSIGGIRVLSDIPQSKGPQDLRNLLVFADGELEIDDIRLAWTSDASVDAQGEFSVKETGDGKNSKPGLRVNSVENSEIDGINRSYRELVDHASSGRFESVQSRIESSSGLSEGSLEDIYVSLHCFTMLAYGLKQEGRNRQAVVVAVRALRFIEKMEETMSELDRAAYQLELDLTKGRIFEDLLMDDGRALDSYNAATSRYPDYEFSKQRAERMARRSNRTSMKGDKE